MSTLILFSDSSIRVDYDIQLRSDDVERDIEMIYERFEAIASRYRTEQELLRSIGGDNVKIADQQVRFNEFFDVVHAIIRNIYECKKLYKSFEGWSDYDISYSGVIKLLQERQLLFIKQFELIIAGKCNCPYITTQW